MAERRKLRLGQEVWYWKHEFGDESVMRPIRGHITILTERFSRITISSSGGTYYPELRDVYTDPKKLCSKIVKEEGRLLKKQRKLHHEIIERINKSTTKAMQALPPGSDD